MNEFSKILLAIIVGLVVTVIALISCNQNLNKENKKLERNNEVLCDSIEIITTKYGETIYANNSLILDKKELEEKLDITKKQLRDYEKQLDSKLAYIAKLESKLSIKDTVINTIVVVDLLNNSYMMAYKNDWFSFNQSLTFRDNEVTSQIYDFVMNLPLKVGLTDDYKIFVTSPNPYFKVTSMEGAVIDKSRFAQEQRRFHIGAYGGFGLNYGLITKQIDIGPQIGIGVIYIIW